ncbi:leucinerich repeat kinase [Pelomyxa schiedti]|nr:leucinerich repeat kinase [Pelomyxa schiedti]
MPEWLLSFQLSGAGAILQLDLSFNHLTSSSVSDLKVFSSLQALQLHHNQLHDLPQAFSCLRQLQDLDLSFNSLSSSSCLDQLQHVVSLEKLLLHHNSLSSLPRNLSRLVNIHALDISSNSFSSLPSWLFCLPLQIFGFQSNPIESAELLQLANSRDLDSVMKILRNRNQHPCDEDSFFTFIEAPTPVKIFPQRLEPLPILLSESLPQLPDLCTKLSLAHQFMDTVPPWVTSSALLELDLSDNMIKFLPEMTCLKSLTKLLVHHNKLSVLPLSLTSLIHLQVLDLSNNNFESLPSWLCTMPPVSLNFVDNPLSALPSNIVASGSQKQLFQFFKQMSSQVQMKTLKLLVLGTEGVGKTSLVRAIQGKDFTKPLSTDGINIVDINTSTLTFRTFDCGGQVNFLPSNQLFVSKDSIILIVFDLRAAQISCIHTWLQHVSMFCSKKDPSIFIVGTHADQFASPELAEQALTSTMKHFVTFKPFIRGIFSVSNSNHSNIGALMSALTTYAQEHLAKLLVPSSYEVLSQVLRQRAENGSKVMMYDEVEHWAAHCKIENPDVLHNALDLLHHMGLIVLIPDYSMVRANPFLIITDPQWISDVVSAIVSFSHSFGKSTGILSVDELIHIWKSVTAQENAISAFTRHKVKKGLFDLLVDLLTSLEFAYKLAPPQQGLLVPSLLPIGRPPSICIWPTQTVANAYRECGRVIVLPFYPIGFFGRLLTRVLHLPALEKIVWWDGGVLLKSTTGDDKVLIELRDMDSITTATSTDRNITSLHIKLRTLASTPTWTEQSTSILVGITDSVENLIKFFYPKLFALSNWLVPCTHCLKRTQARDCDIFYFSQEDCISVLLSGSDILFCNELPTRPVSLHDLLPDFFLTNLETIDISTITKLKELGKGGFGVVWKGLYRGVTVAVKELISIGKEAFSEFHHEVKMMSALTHPNIVQLFGVSHSPLALVMEYAPLGDLYHFIHSKRTEFPQALRVLISLDIAQGISYLHSMQPPIIHRDLRSPNIFIVSTSLEPSIPHAKVADFGLSERAVSMKGTLPTWQWLAPEVLSTEDIQYTVQSDVYSYGIILYEIFTLQYPFDEVFQNPQLCKVVGADARGRPVREIKKFQVISAIMKGLRPNFPPNCAVPPQLRKLITNCWQHTPTNRPEMRSVVSVLSNVLVKESSSLISRFTGLLSTRVEEAGFVFAARNIVHHHQVQMKLSPCEVTMKPMGTIFTPGQVFSLCIVEDWLWVGGAQGKIDTFSLSNFKLTWSHQLTPPRTNVDENITGIATSHRNSLVYIISDTGALSVLQSNPPKSLGLWRFESCSFKSLLCICPGEGESTETIWATNPTGGEVRVWKATTEMEPLKCIREVPQASSLTQCGVLVYIGALSKILIVDAATYSTMAVIELGEIPSSVNALCFTNHLLWLCVTGSPVIHLCNPEGTPYALLRGHSKSADCICSIGGGGTVTMGGSSTRGFEFHKSNSTNNGEEKLLIHSLSGGSDGTVMAWATGGTTQTPTCVAEQCVEECASISSIVIVPNKSHKRQLHFFCGTLSGNIFALTLQADEPPLTDSL